MASQIIVDDFLDDFELFRRHCDNVSYDGESNPADNVFYPGVSLDIPRDVEEEIISKIQVHIGQKIKLKSMFLRLSTLGMEAPHGAHTDAIMGQCSLMLYLNRAEDCEGGTSFLVHKKTGLCATPINEKQLKTWRDDTNNHDMWQITGICPMIPNRAFIFDANMMHRAEPVGGFGENSKDGRLVLTAFFDYD